MNGFILFLCLLLSSVTIEKYSPLDGMPILKNNRQYLAASFLEKPEAKRGYDYIYYLQCSVKIKKDSFAGSGTICYYDGTYAYIVSCGHLFKDNRSPPTNETCQVIVFYNNNQKLIEPQTFDAEVICHSSKEDISFIKFKPNWQISHYFVIAPSDFKLEKGTIYESTGCDNAEPPASYTVLIDKIDDDKNLLTMNNSPRPGRSGGGLLSKDGYYLGIVWGTDGDEGYYVPPERINRYASQFLETRFLLNLSNVYTILNNIKIVDKNGRERFFTIPSP